jgi:hypothetical protein
MQSGESLRDELLAEVETMAPILTQHAAQSEKLGRLDEPTVETLRKTSHVQSVHLSYRVASTGRRTGRDDAVDFREIVCREHNARGAHVLLNVLARFRSGYRDNEDSRSLSLGYWPRDGELGERGVLPPRNGLERRAQPEVLLDIDTLKAR